MPAEHIIAAFGLGFLVVGGLLMVRSIRRAREVCDLFAERLPAEYDEAGSPRPGYFDSVRRTAYFEFVMQRHFADLPDPHLVDRFTALREIEMRHLAFLLGGFGALGVAFVWLHFVHGHLLPV